MKVIGITLLMLALVVQCQQNHPILGGPGHEHQRPDILLEERHETSVAPQPSPQENGQMPPPPPFFSGPHEGPHHGPHQGRHHGPGGPGGPHRCRKGMRNEYHERKQNGLEINQDATSYPLPDHPSLMNGGSPNPTKPTGFQSPVDVAGRGSVYMSQDYENFDEEEHRERHGRHHRRKCRWGKVVLPIVGILAVICLVKKCKKCRRKCRMQRELMRQQQQQRMEPAQPPMIVPVQRGLEDQLTFHRKQVQLIEATIRQQQQQQVQMQQQQQQARHQMQMHPVYEPSMEPVYGQPVHGYSL